jgi:hypothetical protein
MELLEVTSMRLSEAYELSMDGGDFTIIKVKIYLT